MPGFLGVTPQPPAFSVLHRPVWNLLRYPDAQTEATDFSTRPGTLAAVTVTPTTVFQGNPQQQVTGFYWVVVSCDLSDPTSFSPFLAFQMFTDTNYVNFVNYTFIQDLATLTVTGFFSNGPPNAANAQSALPNFQQFTTQSQQQSQTQTLSNRVVEVWYLFGYPDARTQTSDITVTGPAIVAAGGTSTRVDVFGGSTQTQQYKQPGNWTLLRLPTVTDANGNIIYNSSLQLDGFLRLIFDYTDRTVIDSKFHLLKYLRIVGPDGMLFDGRPMPGAVPLVPIQAPQETNAYVPQGIHFDGQTGLVTARTLITNNTGKISFAGWFNINPQVSGQLEFSQGNGSNKLFVDALSPGATWCHLMGTIDAAANLAVLVLNGQSVGTVSASGSPFSSVPTTGALLYIGTDNQGGFFTGDIADLSIWYDVSWIVNGAIPGTTIAKMVDLRTSVGGVTTITPKRPEQGLFSFNVLQQPFQVNPGDGSGNGNLSQAVLPDVFLSGPSSVVTTPHLIVGMGIAAIDGPVGLRVVAGTPTNSVTNPTTITLVPT